MYSRTLVRHILVAEKLTLTLTPKPNVNGLSLKITVKSWLSALVPAPSEVARISARSLVCVPRTLILTLTRTLTQTQSSIPNKHISRTVMRVYKARITYS